MYDSEGGADKVKVKASTVTLGHFFDLLLLLERVGGLKVALLDIDDLVSQHFGNGALRAEGVLADTLGDQVNGLVDSPEGRHVHCLLAHHTACTDPGRVLTGSSGHH